MRPETGAKSLHLLPLIAFCTAAKAAHAPRLRVSAHATPVSQTKKLLACDPALSRPDPPGCVPANLHMKNRLDENRFERRRQGSPGPSLPFLRSNFAPAQAARSERWNRWGQADAGAAAAGYQARQTCRRTRGWRCTSLVKMQTGSSAQSQPGGGTCRTVFAHGRSSA